MGDEVILFRIDDAVHQGDRARLGRRAQAGRDAVGRSLGLMLTGVTAAHALHAALDAGPGDTLLFHNGSGGVGIMGRIEIAVAGGVRVIATASERNHEFLRALGAEPVTYGPGLLERVRELAPDGVDAAIDSIGTDEAVEVSQALVADPARFVTLVGSPARFQAGIKVLGGMPGADPGTEIRMAARLELVDLVEAGKLQVFVDRTYPLADAAAAHAEVKEGHVRGKVALIP